MINFKEDDNEFLFIGPKRRILLNRIFQAIDAIAIKNGKEQEKYIAVSLKENYNDFKVFRGYKEQDFAKIYKTNFYYLTSFLEYVLFKYK